MEAIAKLEFSLPEQEHDFKYALSGLDTLLALSDLDEELRSAIKYNSGELAYYRDDETKERKKCCAETLDRVRERLWEIKSNYKLPELI